MSTISLSMIVKNEEKFLADCLESVKNSVDEIIIVDTGSSDNTVEIAKSFGASIFYYEWNKNFSEARNFALSKTNSEWVLYLDADERLDKKSSKELKLITSGNEKLGIRCKIYNIDEVNKKPKLQNSTRLFKYSSGIEFRGKAHEQIDGSLLENGYQIKNSNLLINHFGYNIDKNGLRRKAERNLELLLEDYESKPTGYCAFQIANSYSILNNKEKAYRYYTLSLSDLTLAEEYQSYALSNIAEYYLRLNDIEKAVVTVNDALNCDPKNMITNLTASEIYFKAGKGLESVNYCKKALLENETKEKDGRLLDVFLDSEKIIYHGLNVSFGTNQKEGIEFFFDKLEKAKQHNHLLWRKELNLIQLVSMNSPLSPDEINDSVDVICDNNIDFYLTLFKNYNHTEIKLDVDKKLISKFPDNAIIKNKYAYNLSKAGKSLEAIDVFENNLKEYPDDVSPIFYLVSLYLEQQQYEKLGNIITTSKRKFSENKTFISHIEAFENKINSYLLNTN